MAFWERASEILASELNLPLYTCIVLRPDYHVGSDKMFAVKGWSVDSSTLKPQTEVFKSSKSQDGDNQQNASRKRKRKHAEAKQDPNVNPENVGQLWGQHVEGKDLSKSQIKREQTRQKLDKMREEKTGPYALPNAMAKPKGERKIERWEDIALGTRAEKLGLAKNGKKGKRKDLKLEGQVDNKKDKDSKSSKDRDADTNNKSDAEGNKNGVAATSRAGDRSEVQKRRHEDSATLPEVPPVPQSTKLTPMQSAMRQKLVSARFRHLNETLYTEPSSAAQTLFDENPEMFEDYHSGFRQQVSVWPENPLDKFIITIRMRGRSKPNKPLKKRKANATYRPPKPQSGLDEPLPRTNGTCVIADLGCGDGRLAKTLTNSEDTTILRLKLHSYDLHSPSPLVTKADTSALPLPDDSVDVAIFCLALMGTNWISFVEEAHRILHWKGELWIAEIKSRFGRVKKSGQPVEHSVGGKRKLAVLKKVQDAKQREQEELDEQQVLQEVVDGVANPFKEETDVSAFIAVLKRRGFILKPSSERAVDLKNKMFVKMEFMKALPPTKGKGAVEAHAKGAAKPKTKVIPVDEEDVDTEDETGVLKPCLYKIR